MALGWLLNSILKNLSKRSLFTNPVTYTPVIQRAGAYIRENFFPMNQIIFPLIVKAGSVRCIEPWPMIKSD